MNRLLKLRQKRAQLIADMTAITDAAADAQRAMTEEENQRFDALRSEETALRSTLERIEAGENLRTEVDGDEDPEERDNQDRRPRRSNTRAEGDAGFRVARIVRCLAATRGNASAAAAFAREQLRDEYTERALSAGQGSGGGFTVAQELASEFIELLRPASLVRRMGARTIPMPNGNLTMPRMATGSNAEYIGENVNIAKTEPTFGQLTLTARKLAALVPVSNDLIRFGGAGVDRMIREDLIQAVAQREDAAFIRDQGLGNAPKGLRYWIRPQNILAANGTVNIANVEADLQKLETAIMNGNVPFRTPGWMMAPRVFGYLKGLRNADGMRVYPELGETAPTLKGYPVGITTQIPTNLGGGSNETEIYLVEFSQVVIGETMSLILESSYEAAYHDGSQVVAAFSQDQTVIRTITQHDLALRQPAAGAVLTGVTWA